jgi:hypothetical protein
MDKVLKEISGTFTDKYFINCIYQKLLMFVTLKKPLLELNKVFDIINKNEITKNDLLKFYIKMDRFLTDFKYNGAFSKVIFDQKISSCDGLEKFKNIMQNIADSTYKETIEYEINNFKLETYHCNKFIVLEEYFLQYNNFDLIKAFYTAAEKLLENEQFRLAPFWFYLN